MTTVAKADINQYFREDDATFSDSSWDILHQHGDIVSALLYSTIFCPEFIEVDGSILLKDNIDEGGNRFRAARTTSKTSISELEASFNLVEIAYMFACRHVSMSDAIEEKLAKILRDSWSDKLKRDYPSRQFSVTILSPEESGSIISIQFFEVR